MPYFSIKTAHKKFTHLASIGALIQLILIELNLVSK